MNTSFLLGIPGKLKTLMDRLTSDRAGYLDNIPTINTNAARLTPTRAGYIDYLPTINSRVTAAVATASALATVDANVDKLVKAQDLFEIQGSILGSGADETALDVTGSGNLLYIGIGAATAATIYYGEVYVTTDGGTQRTIDLSRTAGTSHYNLDGSSAQLAVNVRYNSSLNVVVHNPTTNTLYYYFLWTVDK